MRLDEISSNPTSSLIAMERYVNEGSPSGFTFINTTSEATRPRGFASPFHLAEVIPKKGVSVHHLGAMPVNLFTSESVAEEGMLVHPDMLQHPNLMAVGEWKSRQSWFAVEPTSSPRTVRLGVQDPNGYLKLHHEAHLGRIVRRVTLKHAQAALETDAMLMSLIETGKMPNSFAYYREIGARVYRVSADGREIHWGMIWRPAQVFGNHAARIAYLVPAFSLFSRDWRESETETLLQQLGEVHVTKRVQFLAEELLVPLVRSYFAMLLHGGLQGEWHPQNVLFGFDATWHCVGTVLRDLESVDRDLPLMSRSGNSTNLPSYPYKCFEDFGENYAIRHSFMFDHKFGEYLLAPLIDHACGSWNIQPASVDRVVVDAVMPYIDTLPSDFFPKDGCWYKFADQLIDQSVPQRPYIRFQSPRFRLVTNRN